MNEFENFPDGFAGLDHDGGECDACHEALGETFVLTDDGQFCDEHCEKDFAVSHNLVVVTR